MYNKKQNDMNKEFLYMQKLAGIITESEYKEKMEEGNGIKVTFLKQDEIETLPDEPTNEYEEDVMDAYLFDTDQMLFDRTYSSLEDLAQTIVDENGGDVANWVSILNRMIKNGIISIG
jgi:biotin-(acetyl-CoA carboxylase) ligase